MTEEDKFARDGMGFLLRYARKRRGRPFCAEDVTLAAQSAGVVPQDLRHWGQLFAIAAREGHIRRCSAVYRRAMGNGSLTLGWIAV